MLPLFDLQVLVRLDNLAFHKAGPTPQQDSHQPFALPVVWSNLGF